MKPQRAAFMLAAATIAATSCGRNPPDVAGPSVSKTVEADEQSAIAGIVVSSKNTVVAPGEATDIDDRESPRQSAGAAQQDTTEAEQPIDSTPSDDDSKPKKESDSASKKTQSTKTKQSKNANPDSPNPKTYTVKPGDTLSTIAEKFGVSTKELAAVNNLGDRDRIRDGRKLKLPT